MVLPRLSKEQSSSRRRGTTTIIASGIFGLIFVSSDLNTAGNKIWSRDMTQRMEPLLSTQLIICFGCRCRLPAVSKLWRSAQTKDPDISLVVHNMHTSQRECGRYAFCSESHADLIFSFIWDRWIRHILLSPPFNHVINLRWSHHTYLSFFLNNASSA